MRGTRFSEEQIVAVLKEHEQGVRVEDLCRGHSISQQTFYRWKAKYGGLEVGDAQKLKALEEENRRLKGWWPTWRWTTRRSRTCCQKTGKARGEALGGAVHGSRVDVERASGLRADSGRSHVDALPAEGEGRWCHQAA